MYHSIIILKIGFLNEKIIYLPEADELLFNLKRRNNMNAWSDSGSLKLKPDLFIENNIFKDRDNRTFKLKIIRLLNRF